MTGTPNSKNQVQQPSDSRRGRRVLHIVVGHGLRTYFLNAVRSVRNSAPNDEILVVDNASFDVKLREELISIANADARMRLILRESNDLTNGKVGGLYDAYREAFNLALEEGFDYVHLVQGDMQVLWWDEEVVSRASELFNKDVRCVNVFTCLLSSDRLFSDELVASSDDEVLMLRHYGLTDTGLYHLERWKAYGISFDDDELIHSKKYLALGFTVVCHPWPTDAQIPWPAVVRRGVQRGREISPTKPHLLRPLSEKEIMELKRRNWTWLEEICIPWGWKCLTPMWTTHLNADYLAARRTDIARNGFRSGVPRWEKRGLDKIKFYAFWRYQYRPSLLKLFVYVPSKEILTRILRRLKLVKSI